ncbi:PAS domain-containing protein [Glycocaulis sp.]|uniref:PAS domain-containing protein n=1 Tax=Glycocaulis sp. TaxID=1969725 RepID=UPI0025C5D2D9|nr:PAS domain-containing protein [Glycocaulis sp.]MCH8520829.1 PAS domain-containing protein [Glycocaulis sp.]
MASTRTYQDAFNAMPGACALICADGKIIAANTRFGRLFGERAMISRPLSGLYADPLDALTSGWHRQQTAGTPESAVLRDAGGAPFPARISVTTLPGGVRMAVVETVSDAGRHQDALQRARRRVDAAFEAGSAGAYSVDFPARKVVVSGLLERFFGPQASDAPVSLSRWLAAIHPEDLAAMRVALGGGADDPMDVFRLTCRMRTAANVWVWTRHDLRVVERQRNGEPGRITGLVHDIAAPAGDNPANARVRARLDLAMTGLELSTWEFDFDTLEGLLEGPITRALDVGTGKVSIGEEMLRARLHPDDAERVHAAFMGLQYGGSYDETFRILSPEGYWLWFRSWGQMLPSGGESGSRPRKAFGFWQQLPGQRDDIAAPLDSDIAGVLDRAGLSGWAYDFQARTLTLSGPVLTAVGLTGANNALAIEDWRARVHPEDRPAMDRATEKLLTTGSAHVEYRVRTEGGSWIWLSLRGGISAQTAKGEALRASGVFAEATRRKEAERRLADSESLLSHALTSAALGAWELDYKAGEFRPRGEIREMLGLEAGQDWIASKIWLEHVHPEDREALNATIKAIVADTPGRVRSVEYRALDPRTNTYRWVEGRGSRLGPESERADCAGIVLDISDRKALEESLARSEERLARALASARQGTWRVDITAGMLELSELTCRIIGLPAGHDGRLPVKEWRARVHPDDLDRYQEAVGRMQRGEPVDIVYRMNAGEAGWRWVEDRGATTVRDADGRALETIGTLVDITQRRELEIELAEREARLGEAMDAGLSAIWSIDHQTGEQSVRGTLLEWMGRDIGADKVTLEDWNRIIHPDDRDLARRALADLMNGRPGGPIDYRLRSADGWRWVRAKGETTARDKDGNPIRSGGVVVDITAERALAEALDAERERLDRTTPVMMVSLSPDGHVVAVSEYWLSLLGYERDQVIGKPYDAFLTPASAEKMIALGGMEALIEAGTMRDVHARLVKANGEVIDIISSASVEFGPDGAPIAAHGISIDVTEKLAQARNLKHYAEELERTNRELDRFATVASHDLQEPLRKISAFASLIKRRHYGEFDHETDRSLDFLVDAAGRMRRVIDDLLTYSRTAKRMLEFRNVDMNATVRELLGELDILVTEARAQIEIGELPVIKGDPTLLRLLIQNLITNALKYRKDEGVRIAISAVQEGVHWRFTVSDNGIGFDPRFAEKVFAPFQRLHGREDYEGTGIGLAICQQAVERHGGQIWVETEPGNGASFHFTLPAGRIGERDAA